MSLSATEASPTIGTTEYSCPNSSTTLTPQTTAAFVQAFFDVSAVGAADEFLIQIYEKVVSGGTQRLLYTHPIVGVQSKPNIAIPGLHLRNGWDITIKKIAGTDRAIPFSIRMVA